MVIRLINKLSKAAGLPATTFNAKASSSFVAMSNIENFNNAAKAYGVPTTALFQTPDLYEGRKGPLLNVINCLNQLGFVVCVLFYFIVLMNYQGVKSLLLCGLIIDHITGFAPMIVRPSVCLSISHRFLARKLTGEENQNWPDRTPEHENYIGVTIFSAKEQESGDGRIITWALSRRVG